VHPRSSVLGQQRGRIVPSNGPRTGAAALGSMLARSPAGSDGRSEPGRSLPRAAVASPPRARPFGAARMATVAEPPIPAEPMSDMVGLASTGRTGSAGNSDPARTVLQAGDPYPPISGLPGNEVGASIMEKRITPRSPRAALEPEQVTVPTRRSKRVRNPLVIVGNAIFTLLILLVIGAGAALVFGKLRFEAPGPLKADKVVVIPPRAGLMEIADLLQREGVIDEHKIIFIGGVVALKARSGLKSGEYLFTKHASVRDVVETLLSGKVVQHLLTIPEGLTSEQIVARLLDNKILSGPIKDIPREGSMLPDSYNFKRGDTRAHAIQRMQQAQQLLLTDVWERRSPDLPLRTPDQLIILASIIEKETSKPEERTRIAAVFVNRLKQKMRLQTDPTVIYGLAPGKGTLGHPLTKADLEKPTPYNTYIIDALPPGPIANPGRASIEAAANPARTKELYFVADGTGGHAFSETYEQHLRNVARLRALQHGHKPPQAPALSTAEETPLPPTPVPRLRRGSKKRR
jgi:peptidoglycan lytic transglycosylase G